MKHPVLMLTGAMLLVAPCALAQPYEIPWHTVDGGGAMGLAGGSYVLSGTAGQADAGGPLSGGDYVLSGGFWPGAARAPRAELSVTKADSADPVTGLALFTYTIEVTNGGPDVATNVSVEDTLPGGVVFFSVGGTGWSCGEAAGVVTCQPDNVDDSLPVGVAPDITIEVRAPQGPTVLSNTATVSADEDDTVPGDDAATEGTTVLAAPQADLGIDKSDGGVTAVRGEPLTYTITVTNSGPDAAPGATVADAFPADLESVTWGCVASAGSSCAPSGSGDISDSASLLAGGTLTYSATGTVAVGATDPMTNTATVTAPPSVLDPNAGNDSATVVTEVTDPVDVIFEDGFESGDTSAWSNTVGGAFPEPVLHVPDEMPERDSIYRGRVSFDPGTLDSKAKPIGFSVTPDEGGRPIIGFTLEPVAEEYVLAARARPDVRTKAAEISADPHDIRFEWILGSTRSEAGSLRIWVDGTLVGESAE